MLANSSWFSTFNEGVVWVKNRGLMDHCPLVFSTPMQLERFSKPFQFYNFMTDLDGFAEAVSSAWSGEWFGDPMAILVRRLQVTKKSLVGLNKKHGNVRANVQLARMKLVDIQDRMRPLTCTHPNLLIEERLAAKILETALLEEEAFLLQKSRVKWLQSGNGNNNFFFNQVKANWNHNKILALENCEGQIEFGQANVAKIAVNYFSNTLGTAVESAHYDLHNIQLQTITAAHSNFLLEPVTPDLIYKTLKSMKRNKAPGPDGFTVEFYLASWDTVGSSF